MPVNLPNPETALALATVLAAWFAARWRIVRLGWWERPLAALARRRRLAILAAALAPLLVRAALLPWRPVPQPRIHDEFTFLLGADTLAEGRLVNPPHPAWPHFETMHILVRPVYVSAFPMGPAAVLAIGQAVFGHPWIGVWLSTGLMCGTLCWMLQGWLPPRWALLGAALAILRLGVSSYWMNSYWGGALAATGGALALGALPRLLRAPHWRLAAVMGVGIAILANSRPFEGAVFSAGIAVWLVAELLGKKRPPGRILLRRISIPLGVVLAIAGAGMAYYNFRVTGHGAMLPYSLYRSSMAVAPHFVWQSPRPAPLYNNRELRGFYLGWELHNYHLARDGFFVDLALKARAYWRFYLGPLFSIPLLALPGLWRKRLNRRAILLAAFFFLALACQVWHYAHYAAPATGLGILLVTMSLRQLRPWRWRRLPAGLYLVRCLPLAAVLLLAIQVCAGPAENSGLAAAVPGWRWPPVATARANVLRELERSGQRHLVFVRYASTHDPGNEWVYNRADIDGSAVIWARELDRASNTALIGRYPERRPWLVEPDVAQPRLIPYALASPRPMPFVAVGAPGIAVLHSPGELRRLLEPPSTEALRSCDVWNYHFTEATGIEGPDVVTGCYTDGDRGQPVTFDRWFIWLLGQR